MDLQYEYVIGSESFMLIFTTTNVFGPVNQVWDMSFSGHIIFLSYISSQEVNIKHRHIDRANFKEYRQRFINENEKATRFF